MWQKVCNIIGFANLIFFGCFVYLFNVEGRRYLDFDTLSESLTILQFIVAVGGIFGFSYFTQVAREKASDVAKKIAEEEARRTAESIATEVAERVSNERYDTVVRNFYQTQQVTNDPELSQALV
jgi:predicted negative regulator of RcsB-dependent stress response